LGVLMETEVWPNLLHEARRRRRAAGAGQCPPVRHAARPRAGVLAALMQPALACFDAVLAQTEADAARLRRIWGAQPVQVLGNLKFDMAPKPELLARGRRLAQWHWAARWCWPQSRVKAKKPSCWSRGAGCPASCPHRDGPFAAAGAAPPAAF
jgi:3-deoxy-D-manno-octulosonic-acid transferase